MLAIAPQVERDRALTLTRTYRVNLNMLALVALWTGAFLVFSTQSLSVLRRRRSLGLLRALGATRGQLRAALVGEGTALGLVGSCLGLILGLALAEAILRFLAGDLGNGQLRIAGASMRAAPLPMLAFLFMGTAAASLGAWVPARNAARQAPAHSLKGGDGGFAALARGSAYFGLALLALGAALARLPPVRGLPVFGYAAIAALLFGAVLLVPTLTVRGLSLAPRTHRVVLDTAVAQLRENVGLSTLSLASIIVSFSLMVAMAIMVYSFRVSFEHGWANSCPPTCSCASRSAMTRLTGRRRIKRGWRVARSLEDQNSGAPGNCCSMPRDAPVTLIARNSTESQSPPMPVAAAATPAIAIASGNGTGLDFGGAARSLRIPIGRYHYSAARRSGPGASRSPEYGETTRAHPAPS